MSSWQQGAVRAPGRRPSSTFQCGDHDRIHARVAERVGALFGHPIPSPTEPAVARRACASTARPAANVRSPIDWCRTMSVVIGGVASGPQGRAKPSDGVRREASPTRSAPRRHAGRAPWRRCSGSPSRSAVSACSRRAGAVGSVVADRLVVVPAESSAGRTDATLESDGQRPQRGRKPCRAGSHAHRRGLGLHHARSRRPRRAPPPAPASRRTVTEPGAGIAAGPLTVSGGLRRRQLRRAASGSVGPLTWPRAQAPSPSPPRAWAAPPPGVPVTPHPTTRAWSHARNRSPPPSGSVSFQR